ncbi:MAG: hypothetical protein OER12_10285 [Acidimicrobiia bacterium]|nr:hypothetical protein [Acidimicrobiia bacterium]
MPPPYTHIGFDSDYSAESADLMDRIEADLDPLGVCILESAATPVAPTFDVAIGKHVFVGTLAAVEGRRWLVFVGSTLRWWKRKLGVSDEADHHAVLQAFEQVLRRNGRVSNIRLYRDAAQWELGDDGVETRG